MATRSNRSQTFENIPIRDQEIITVEYPGHVQNAEKAIESLGGKDELGKIIHSTSTSPMINCHLNPLDPLRLPLPSSRTDTSEIILKITVPKLTGRKRKKGSSGPFSYHLSDEERARLDDPFERLQQSLRDRFDSCRVEAVGQSNTTYQFRNPPDFQYSTAFSLMDKTLNDYVLPFDYDKLSKFKLPRIVQHGSAKTDLFPPPKFDFFDGIPRYYSYSHPGPRDGMDPSDYSISKSPPDKRKSISHKIYGTTESIPQGPLPDLPPLDQLHPHFQTTVANLRAVFDARPVCSKRFLLNALDPSFHAELVPALPYVAYAFLSGPFKNAFARHGLDPRVNPSHRMLQTLTFNLASRRNPGATVADLPTASHIFDGTTFHRDVRVWQLIDITDRQLRRALDAPDAVRDAFDPDFDGWYANGALAKVKVVMRDKLSALARGLPAPPPETYARIMAVPNVLKEPMEEAGMHRFVGAQERALGAEVRKLANLSLHAERMTMYEDETRTMEDEEWEESEDEDEDREERVWMRRRSGSEEAMWLADQEILLRRGR